MSAELAPPPGTGDARTRANGVRRPTRYDVLRDVEFQRRFDAGEPLLDAWLGTLTHPIFGSPLYRGKPSVPPQVVQRSMASHLRRCRELDDASREIASRRLARLTTDAVSRLGAILDGDFGKGRVRVRGRGDDACEVVEIDAASAGVQVQAAVAVLKGARVIESSAKSPVNVSVSGDAVISLIEKLRL